MVMSEKYKNQIPNRLLCLTCKHTDRGVIKESTHGVGEWGDGKAKQIDSVFCDVYDCFIKPSIMCTMYEQDIAYDDDNNEIPREAVDRVLCLSCVNGTGFCALDVSRDESTEVRIGSHYCELCEDAEYDTPDSPVIECTEYRRILGYVDKSGA